MSFQKQSRSVGGVTDHILNKHLTSLVTYAEAILGVLVARECSPQNRSLFQLQPHLLSSHQMSFCVAANQDIHFARFWGPNVPVSYLSTLVGFLVSHSKVFGAGCVLQLPLCKIMVYKKAKHNFSDMTAKINMMIWRNTGKKI